MSSGRFNLSALAVRERSITLFLIILITVAGILSFFELGRAEDPPFTVKQMTIISAWPGATAREMQDQVAEPLEKRLQELKWYDRSETYTGVGFTAVIPLELLQTLFKWLGNLILHFPGGCTRPGRDNGHLLDSKRRIFSPSEFEERQNTGDSNQNNEEQGD